MNSGSVYMIALYIRLSTEDGKVGSFSIENQKRVLHQYVDAMGGSRMLMYWSLWITVTVVQILNARRFRSYWTWCGRAKSTVSL